MLRLSFIIVFTFIILKSESYTNEKELRNKWKISAFTDVRTCLHYYKKYNSDTSKVKQMPSLKRKSMSTLYDTVSPGMKSGEAHQGLMGSNKIFNNLWKQEFKSKTLSDFSKLTTSRFDYPSKKDVKKNHVIQEKENTPAKNILENDVFTKFWRRNLTVKSLNDLKKIDLRKFQWNNGKTSNDDDFDDDDADSTECNEDTDGEKIERPTVWMRSKEQLSNPVSGPHSDTKLTQDHLGKEFFSGSQIDKQHTTDFPFGVIGRLQDNGFNGTEGFFDRDIYAGDYFRNKKGEMKERHQSKTNFAPFLKDLEDKKKKRGYTASTKKKSDVVVKYLPE